MCVFFCVNVARGTVSWRSIPLSWNFLVGLIWIEVYGVLPRGSAGPECWVFPSKKAACGGGFTLCAQQSSLASLLSVSAHAIMDTGLAYLEPFLPLVAHPAPSAPSLCALLPVCPRSCAFFRRRTTTM